MVIESARETSSDDKKAAADVESDEEVTSLTTPTAKHHLDPSARRAALGEFRKRHRYSAPTHRKPADKLFARMARRREKRLLHFRNLKDAVCILDQDLTLVLTRRLELEHWTKIRS